MNQKRSYNLPSGKRTIDAKRYCKEWEALAKPFCEATGSRVFGCDPDVLFIYKGRTFSLPVELIGKINIALKP